MNSPILFLAAIILMSGSPAFISSRESSSADSSIAESSPAAKRHRSLDLSPFDFGWKKARSGEERFEVLYKTHCAAVAKGVDVDYKGIGYAELAIPQDARSIPLTKHNDFKGATLRVVSTTKPFTLFSRSATFKPVNVSGKQIDDADFREVGELSSGLWILAIQDETPWVKQRGTRPYGAIRRDICLVRDGLGSNGPCAPYDTPATKVKALFCQASDEEKTFCNLNFVRAEESSKMVMLMSISGQNNFHISNVTVKTPQNSGWNGDHTISINWCTNILCEDISFDGTYSLRDKYGYGISCNGVWNSVFRRMSSNCAWGVFGNNNTHDSVLEDSEVERFDTHCYGRNITVRRCTLLGRGVPVASIFGTILVEDCYLEKCHPYTCRDDYYTYVPFELVVRNCVMAPKYNHVFRMGKLNAKIHERPENVAKNWPNVLIENLTVKVPRDADKMILFQITNGKDEYGKPLEHMSSVRIDGMRFEYEEGCKPVPLYLCRFPVKTKGCLNIDIRNLDLVGDSQSGGPAPEIVVNLHGESDNFNIDYPQTKVL